MILERALASILSRWEPRQVQHRAGTKMTCVLTGTLAGVHGSPGPRLSQGAPRRDHVPSAISSETKNTAMTRGYCQEGVDGAGPGL